MDTDSGDEQQANDTMGQSAQSISSSRTSTSMAETILINVQSRMWGSVVSAQCAPMVLNLLMTQTERVSQDDNKGNMDHARDMTNLSNTPEYGTNLEGHIHTYSSGRQSQHSLVVHMVDRDAVHRLQ
eukprot:5826063-Amphidinium_carterae.1